MGQTVILTSSNYTGLVGGKNYKFGDYCFNYPVTATGDDVGTNIGSKLMVASGGLLNLLPNSSMNITNKPLYPFIAIQDGMIYEIDYVIDDTSAMLRYAANSTNVVSSIPYAILYNYNTPVLRNTALTPSGLSTVNGVTTFNKYSKIVIDLNPTMEENFFSEPFSVDFGATGSSAVLTLKY